MAKDAEAEGEVHAVAILRKEMMSDWRAALALLERRHPERWRRRERREHLTGADERPRIELSELPERDLKALERINARATKPK